MNPPPVTSFTTDCTRLDFAVPSEAITRWEWAATLLAPGTTITRRDLIVRPVAPGKASRNVPVDVTITVRPDTSLIRAAHIALRPVTEPKPEPAIAKPNLRRVCVECGRVFDMFDANDADEWHHGHDCEATG